MHHTSALILRKDPWGEADCLVTAFTPFLGRIRLLAQGVRRHGAKLQGHLEPGFVSDISFVIGRNGYRLTTARVRASFPGIRASFGKRRALAFAIAAVDQNFFEGTDGAAPAFAVFEDFLAALDDAPDGAAVRRLLIWLTVRLLSLLGIFPDGGSQEGERSDALAELGSRDARAAARTPSRGDEGALAGDLGHIIRHLGGAVRIPERVLAAEAESALS